MTIENTIKAILIKNKVPEEKISLYRHYVTVKGYHFNHFPLNVFKHMNLHLYTDDTKVYFAGDV